jgi:indole-3-glycerol phosphate synthase
MTVLAEIIAAKRAEIARRKAAKPLAELEAALPNAPEPRRFADALTNAVERGGYGLIAEIKRASPSKGLIRADFDPPALARAYEAGGAACLSVLTDEPYFQGRDEHLVAARAAVNLPVLRKDFMLDPYQLVEARLLGADCILLIMAALEDDEAEALALEANRLEMDILVEVHHEGELGRAINLPFTGLARQLIGINNRDLKSLQVDLSTTRDLAPLVPHTYPVVAESGLRTPEDLAQLAALGVRRFLVGEQLMAQPDVEAATRALLAPLPARTRRPAAV